MRAATHAAISEAYSGDDLISELFRKAIELDGQKRELFAVVTANRTTLRNLATQGLVSREDVNAMYPPKASTTEEAEVTEAA
jgi:hypothetical protein